MSKPGTDRADPCATPSLTVSTITGRTFIVDPRVRANVTILSSTPMSPEAFYQAFLSILQVHGFMAVQSGNVTKILPDANARQVPANDLPERVSATSDELRLHEQDGAVCFDVKVAPRASRSAILGVHAGALKLSVTAAPVDGAGNTALIELLAEQLDVPKRALRIVRGEHQRSKTVCVQGVALAELRAVLLEPGRRPR